MINTGPLPEAPYRGIAPFTSGDEAFFFGREVERSVLYAHVRSRPLTVLYGTSGVGKSSLLQAGLVGHLLRIANENLERRSAPEIAVAVVNSWREAPARCVLDAVAHATPDISGGDATAPLPAGDGLKQALEIRAARAGGTLFLLLDQFEDYLRRDVDSEFEDALAEIVNAPGSVIRVLISVQEESLARLDRLEERIPGLFGDALRLEQLDRKGVESAIKRPLEKWNEIHEIPTERAYRAEDELIAAIFAHRAIDDVNATESPRAPATELAIGTAYLQLVLMRLWDEELRLGSHVLRKSTLDTLGGITDVVQKHLDAAMASLSARDRKKAADVLRFLVTPFGNKNALAAFDLADYTGLSEAVVEKSLSRMSEVRVVRAVMGSRGAVLYEIFHQALVPAIRHWREEVDRSHSARWKKLAVAACLALVVSLLFSVWRSRERQLRLTRASVLAQTAESLRTSHFDLSLLLSLHALEFSGERNDPSALLSTLNSPAGLGAFVGWGGSAIVRTMCDLKGATLAVAGADGSLRHWSVSNRRPLGNPLRADWREVSDLAFSRDGRTLALVASDATVRIRSTIDNLFPIASFGVPDASAVAIKSDGQTVAVGSSDGTVCIHEMPFKSATQTLRIGHAAIEALDFSPDGKLLAIGVADGTVRLSAVTVPSSLLMKQRGESVYCVVFSPDGRMFAAGAADGTLHLWSAVGADWTEQVLQLNRGIRSVAFSPKGDIVAAADDDGVIRVWSVLTTEPVGAPLVGHRSRMRNISFTGDGRIISGQDDGSIRLWTVAAAGKDPGRRDLDSLRSRVCGIANRNLSAGEWKEYMGDVPYRRTCARLPPGEGVSAE